MSNAGQQLFSQVIKDYQQSLAAYRKDAESYWLGETFGMNMEQTIKVGDQKITASTSSSEVESVVTQCPLSGTLRLVHMFESVRFIPIGNTPYKIEPVKRVKGRYVNDGPIKSGTLDAKGIAEVGQLEPGKSYRVSFYPDLHKSDLETLFASYAPVQADLVAWLTQEWNAGLSQDWARYTASGAGLGSHAGAAVSGIGKALVSVWDDLKTIYDLLAHPQENLEKLAEFGIDAAAMAAAGASQIEAGLLVLQDEALLYLYANALISWLRLLPPDQQTEFGAQVVATVLFDVLVGVVLTGGAGLAARYGVKAIGAAKQSERITRLVGALVELSKKHNLAQHAQGVKKVLLAGENKLNPGKKANLDLVDGGTTTKIEQGTAVTRDHHATTRIEQADNTPDSSSPATTGSGHASQRENETCLNNCPVSMVTGEELLALDDGQLPGMLPFTFARLYRTSAVAMDSGMGAGWSHSLSHRLARHGDTLTWWDSEAKAITLPHPTRQMPMATNRLAKAAVYLGDDADEVIVAQTDSPFLHFRWQGNTGRLTALSDTYGNRLEVRHDDQGRPSRVENQAGLALRLRHDNRRITAIELQRFDGIQWQSLTTLQRYHYDPQGQLSAAENGAGERECYEYRADGVILARRLAGGASFFWEWQGEGHLARAIRHWSDVAGFDVRYDWDDDKGQVTVNNADGSQVVYQHDDNARLIRQQDPDGAVSEYVYNDKGQKVLARDGLGAETHYQYDDRGQLSLEIAPDGSQTVYHYWDGKLRKLEQGDREWRFEHNEQGDPVRRLNPLGQQTRYGYTAQGKLAWVEQADGSRIQLGWNRLGQLIEEKAADGTLTRWRYDERGRQILRQDARGAITRYEWDDADRLRQITLPGGGTRRFQYNPYGKVTHEWDEQGRETRYEYHDRLHLISRRINPDGSVLTYRYDNAKRFLSQIENEHGEQHRIHYHPNGLVAEETGFDGRTSRYAYDLNGRLTEKTEVGRSGTELVTLYRRDVMGRLTSKVLPDGQEISFHYDAHGQLTSVEDGHWPLAFSYDKAGRLTAEHQGWASSYFKHDALGQLSQWRLPDGNRLDYQHHNGTLTGIDLNGSELTRHQIVAGLELRRNQGALSQQYEYDEQGRLTALRLQAGQQITHQRQYGYDRSGNLLHIRDSQQGESRYHYDPLDRLLEVRGDLSERFLHDPAGNLLSQTQGSAFTSARTQGNRLLFSGDRHFDYDEFGRLTAERRGKGQALVTRYEYDCQHRLIQAELPDGSTAHYHYDAFGRRIRKTLTRQGQAPLITEFLWQANNLIAESRCDGTYRSFIYEPGSFRPLVQLEGEGEAAEPYHYQLDQIGTPLALTSHSGQTAWRVRYRAYGNVWKQEIAEVESPLRFQGQYHDAETGLHYNRHRYYQPDTGRFITPDPIGLAGGLNNYQYAPNPTGWVDPLGLMFKAANCPSESPTSPNPIDKPSEPPSVVAARERQNKMLVDDVGYNISPISWDQYPSIGRDGTFVTDTRGVMKYFEDARSGEVTISKKMAAVIENDMGLNPGSLSEGFNVREIKGINSMSPRSPLSGNDYFKGPGQHLPGGAPELVIDSVPTSTPIMLRVKVE